MPHADDVMVRTPHRHPVTGRPPPTAGGKRGAIRGWAWVAGGMAAAAVMGACTLAVQGLLLAMAAFRAASVGLPAQGGVAFAILALPLAVAIAGAGFLTGLVAIGAPAWLVLHGLGLRKRREAMIAGAVLSALTAGPGLYVVTGGESGFVAAMAAMLLFLIPGAAAGWTLHRIAYGASPHGGLPRSSARR